MSLGENSSTGRVQVKRHSLPSDEFAGYLGLDWADARHTVRLLPAGGEKRESLVLEHQPEAIDAWARALRERFNAKPLAVALELFKGPIVNALRKYDCFVLFPVNPSTLPKYRQT